MNSHPVIKPKDLENFLNLDKETEIIENRLSHIFHSIFEANGYQLSTWWIDGADEGEVGDLNKLFRGWSTFISTSNITFELIEGNYDSNLFTVDIDDGRYRLLESIPKKWLFSDFEQELLDGLKSYKQSLSEHKQSLKEKRLRRLAKKNALIDSVRLKLTIEEQKAVGIYKGK